MIRWELSPFHRFAPVDLFAALLAALVLSVRSHAALQLEVVALRHQLGVLQRSVKRPTLTSSDRLFWAWLCRVWPDWRSALVIVRPDTVIAWHRTGFRLFWKWKTLCGRPGRPPVPTDVRPGFPISLWYRTHRIIRRALISRGSDARNPTTKGDTRWVKKKDRRFSSRSTAC